MNQEQQTELLIEIRADVRQIKEWIPQHCEQHKEEKSNRFKLLLPLYTALVGVLVKLIWWR